MSDNFKMRMLMKENGNLRTKIRYYADRYEYLGGRTLLQECNKWKKKYELLNKEVSGKGEGSNYKKKYHDAETELGYYKSKFFEYEYKLKEEVRNNVGVKRDNEYLKISKEKMSRDLFELMNKNKIMEDLLHINDICLDSNDSPDSSYGYNSMEACIEDMNSDNPQYPFTEKEKEKINKDNKKLEQKEEVMEENNEKLEEVVENKEEEYSYSGLTAYEDLGDIGWKYHEDPELKNNILDVGKLLKIAKFKKRVYGSIRKKHKELYKKHKVIVGMTECCIDKDTAIKVPNSDIYSSELKIKYFYELELKDKPKKKTKINI